MYGAFSRYNRPRWRVRRGTHEARALWAKQREVSPMKQGVPQASLRASEAAKRLEPRGHGAKRSPQGRNTAQALAQGGAKSKAAKRLKPRGHGAKRSPQGRNTGPPKTARCEDAGRPLRIVDSLLPRHQLVKKLFDKLSRDRRLSCKKTIPQPASADGWMGQPFSQLR